MTTPLRERAIHAARQLLPRRLRNWIVTTQRELGLVWPTVGQVGLGDLRRLTPISPVFALDRGQPVERYYIERFLDRHRADVRGRGLEFGDTTYLDRFGGERVTRKDVFSYVPVAGATIVGDLTGSDPLPEAAFDVIICTQTIQMIFDIEHAIQRLGSMLRPGGVLLVTTHGTSKVGRHPDRDGWSEYWHLTRHAARVLFERNFPGSFVVEAFGNVLAAVAALHGLAVGDVTTEELDYADRDFDVIIGVRAVKQS